MGAAPEPFVRTTWLTSVLRAPNPGPMTLDGTNSYRLADPGADVTDSVVVDPGPDEAGHLQRLAGAGRVALILITHRHPDHTGGAEELHQLTGAPVRAADPVFCRNGEPLVDGEIIRGAGVEIEVLATPGHSADSVCLRLSADRPETPDPSDPAPAAAGSVLTGDSVLGRGTAVIAHPDGELGAYLASLRRLTTLGPATVLPGHGPTLPDLGEVCRAYLEHREQRLDAIRAALAELSERAGLGLAEPAIVKKVTDLVYTDIDPSVRWAAELSVAAQLAYLRSRA